MYTVSTIYNGHGVEGNNLITPWTLGEMEIRVYYEFKIIRCGWASTTAFSLVIGYSYEPIDGAAVLLLADDDEEGLGLR